jgi:hypothetical protein
MAQVVEGLSLKLSGPEFKLQDLSPATHTKGHKCLFIYVSVLHI